MDFTIELLNLIVLIAVLQLKTQCTCFVETVMGEPLISSLDFHIQRVPQWLGVELRTFD